MASRTACLGCLMDMHSEEPFDEEGECDRCGDSLSTLCLPMTAASWIAILRQAIYKECLKKHASAYVAHHLCTVSVKGFPLELLEDFMQKATDAGRVSDEDWDKEAPRTQWQALEDKQSWVFTTEGAVAFICDLGTLLKPDSDFAWRGNCLTSAGDVISVVGPFEVNARQEEVMEEVFVNTASLRFSTGIVPRRDSTFLRFTPLHPVDTATDSADLGRWRHLPFYNDYEVYWRWKVGQALKGAGQQLPGSCKKILLSSTGKRTWGAAGGPQVVTSRLPPPSYHHGTTQAVPWQHPKLTRDRAGYKTSGDALRLEAKNAARAAARDKADADYEAQKKAEYERFCYQEGKKITLRVLSKGGGTEQMLLRQYNYQKEDDNRFNGRHAAVGYDGVGPDPCDPSNRRGWLKNFPATWQEHEKKMREEQRRAKRKKI